MQTSRLSFILVNSGKLHSLPNEYVVDFETMSVVNSFYHFDEDQDVDDDVLELADGTFITVFDLDLNP